LCTPTAPCPSNKSCQSRGARPLSDPGFYFIREPRDSTSSELNAFWKRRWLFLFEARNVREAVGYAVDGFQLFLRDQFSNISLDGTRWVACRPNFLLAVEVLSCLFRRLVLEKLAAAHCAGELQFFGKHIALTNPKAFAAYLAPLRNKDWVVYAKRPFGGPQEVLRYLARYTHRVAISNRRLISSDHKGVTFKWKDYRLDGAERYNRVMTLDTSEFIRRFLMHVLPSGFHRIRYYGFLSCQTRAKNIERIRELLAVPLIPVDAIKAANAKASTSAQPEEPKAPEHPCPCGGSNMRIIETFLRGQQPKHRPSPAPQPIRIDTS
jgi:Putative transposase